MDGGNSATAFGEQMLSRSLDSAFSMSCVAMFLQKVSLFANFNRTVGLTVARGFSDATATTDAGQKVGGFAEAYEKHSHSLQSEDVEPKRTPLPFATLLKSSKFVDVRPPSSLWSRTQPNLVILSSSWAIPRIRSSPDGSFTLSAMTCTLISAGNSTVSVPGQPRTESE